MKRTVRKKIKPLIGSIIIAVVLWSMVTTSKDYTTLIEVPVEISRVARGKTLLNEVPEKAIIEVSGSGQSIIALSFYNVKFKLELPDINKNQQIDLLDYLHFLDMPSKFGLEVTKIIEPTKIDLKIDELKIEPKPVKFNGQVNPEPGYIVLDTTYSQDSVMISGPKKIVDNIQFISTQFESFDKPKISFNTLLNLESPHSRLINLNPTEIDVRIEIQRIVERVVYEIPIQIKNIPGKLSVQAIPPKLSLRVKGGEKIVELLKVEEIIAEIDFAIQYNPENKDYAVSLKTPENISWIECSPKTFNLTVKRKQRKHD